MDELQIAFGQIKAAREYVLPMIDDLEPDDWYRQPVDGVSHIAWQVGHLAMAQFRLCLERLRDLQPEDRELIPKQFLRMHSKGSTPTGKPSDAPTPEQLRATLDAVYAQVLEEVPKYAGDDLNEPLINPHPIFTTKLEALYFCSKHEMLHAGQIGLLRRLLGKPPLR